MDFSWISGETLLFSLVERRGVPGRAKVGVLRDAEAVAIVGAMLFVLVVFTCVSGWVSGLAGMSSTDRVE